MNLHLEYIGRGIVHPGKSIPRVPPAPSTVRLHYAICDENGQQLATPGGRYEGEYGDSYKPHSQEREMLNVLGLHTRTANGLYVEVISTPHPVDPGIVRYEAIVTLPTDMEFAEVDLE